jgi:hypothetical protein
MKVRVPREYEDLLLELGCNWSCISLAWVVPVVIRDEVLTIIKEIKAAGKFCDVFSLCVNAESVSDAGEADTSTGDG